MSTHHVTTPPRHAVDATTEAVAASLDARRRGLTVSQCEDAYAKAYARVINGFVTATVAEVTR